MFFFPDDWNSSQWDCRQDDKDTKKNYFDKYFWKRFAKPVKITEPLVKVPLMGDGEKMAMGYIYEAMDQEKEKIQESYKDKVAKYGRIWEIIDNKWNNQLHHPIHAVGYFLNPKYHYKTKLGEDHTREVKDGLYECVECMVPNES